MFTDGVRTSYRSFIIRKRREYLVNNIENYELEMKDNHKSPRYSYNSHKSQQPRTERSKDTRSLQIAIVGAGISGLSAALTLLDSKLFTPKNIHIYDANNYIGGRMHTTLWLPEYQTSEWCGEFLDSNHDFMMNLTKRFNLSLIDTIDPTDSDGSRGTYYFLKQFYNASEAWRDYQAISDTIQQQLELIGDISYNETNSDATYFDNLSLYDWIEKYIPNGHQSQFGAYIDSAYTQEYGLDTREQSSLNFLFAISPESQPENGPLSIYGPSDQRYRIKDGNYLLPEAISKYLMKHKISINLNYNLTKISINDNKKISLRFQNDETYIYDHVILTLPTTTLKYVDYSEAKFDSLKKRVINELRYGTTTKLNLQFKERFWLKLSSDGVIYTDLPFLNSWEATSGRKGETGILTLFTGGTIGTSFEPKKGINTLTTSSCNKNTFLYVEGFLDDLNEIWPNASTYYTGKGTISAPWVDKHFLGSYAAYTLGQYSTISGYEKERQMNIHFSGDYTSPDLQGFMEGAASEGDRAANEIIADYS
ncbi:unnamed protein product [Adineta steineri]|uniref:Amine oxidase n=2 Tax=Adineta steineri TaxID=433720 RepID=A0A813MKJ0_9BILA|nr:unnamed protein product [Adineta steineri]